jgi:hypothetical protein
MTLTKEDEAADEAAIEPIAGPVSPYTVLGTYHVRPGEEEALLALIQQHWPALRRRGLVTEEPARVYRGSTADGTFFIEIVTWIRPEGGQQAYQCPEIKALWAELYDRVEERNGRPGIEYPQIEPVEMPYARGDR